MSVINVTRIQCAWVNAIQFIRRSFSYGKHNSPNKPYELQVFVVVEPVAARITTDTCTLEANHLPSPSNRLPMCNTSHYTHAKITFSFYYLRILLNFILLSFILVQCAKENTEKMTLETAMVNNELINKERREFIVMSHADSQFVVETIRAFQIQSEFST